MKVEKIWENDQGEEITYSFPTKNEVCPRCEGHGYHLTPSIGEYAYSMEEFYQEFDEEGREQYFSRGGIYDIVCFDCKGKNVIAVIDTKNLNNVDNIKYQEYIKWQKEIDKADREYQAICRMERMMGC